MLCRFSLFRLSCSRCRFSNPFRFPLLLFLFLLPLFLIFLLKHFFSIYQIGISFLALAVFFGWSCTSRILFRLTSLYLAYNNSLNSTHLLRKLWRAFLFRHLRLLVPASFGGSVCASRYRLKALRRQRGTPQRQGRQGVIK